MTDAERRSRTKLCGVAALLLTALCTTFGALAQERERTEPAKGEARSMKGFEIYSWRSAKGRWTYALLIGTNRLKSLTEVQAEGLRERRLVASLRGLAPEESVFWCNGMVDGANGILAMPPKRIVEKIRRIAQEEGLRLEVCEEVP